MDLAAGALHTCAVFQGGKLKCWGGNGGPHLGYGSGAPLQGAIQKAFVDVGGAVVQVAAGSGHTCAVLEGGGVRCFGSGAHGKLGYASTANVESPASAGDVPLGGKAVQVAAGAEHTCALLDTGKVRCWGFGGKESWGAVGALGYANMTDVGDDETPASVGDVDVGGLAQQVVAGQYHTCALLQGGKVRCWGWGFHGALGYGNPNSIGDDETPASAGDVDTGGVVKRLAAGAAHTCAILDSGGVRCWGNNEKGMLGQPGLAKVGDDETPASVGDVKAGLSPVVIAGGGAHTCVASADGKIRCWGLGFYGQLGYGNTSNIGDDETPASAGDVDAGGMVSKLALGQDHTCALLTQGVVRCWGRASALGYQGGMNIGDDETPATVGVLPLE